MAVVVDVRLALVLLGRVGMRLVLVADRGVVVRVAWVASSCSGSLPCRT
jgi:hypothetical protein